MPNRFIVSGQRVTREKVERAKELRRQMTPEEKMVWQRLRGNQLLGLHFRRQQVIDGFIADFYCHATGLVVEVDGGIHDQQPEADAERDQVFSARGLRVMRIRNEEIQRNLMGVLRQITEACQTET